MANAFAMICCCFQRQHPEEFGRESIPGVVAPENTMTHEPVPEGMNREGKVPVDDAGVSVDAAWRGTEFDHDARHRRGARPLDLVDLDDSGQCRRAGRGIDDAIPFRSGARVKWPSGLPGISIEVDSVPG